MGESHGFLYSSNAFNTQPWSCFQEALRYHPVPPYLLHIVELIFRRCVPPIWDLMAETRAACRAVFHRTQLQPALVVHRVRLGAEVRAYTG